ncbi:N-6 DNA methylase [Companilactobacillus jidongensis]|uniref:N-6 DNA methylase n=1 Tax=Companilactobacillus jidongensis TaxID=2486006 RepID=UPI000F7B5D5D|nr:N-6 DNA methylase [Companilactobacillus jidongensis]
MGEKFNYSKLVKLMDKSTIIKYHLAMILFVIHGNRSVMLEYLKANPEELVPMFNEKAKELNFKFTDKVPKIIDMDKVQKICLELEKTSASEEVKAWYRMNATTEDSPALYVMNEISGLKKSDSVLIDNLNHGNLIEYVLKNNIDQKIDGFEKTTLYDFDLILVYGLDATNTNLKYGKYVASDKKYDKTLSVINYKKSNIWKFRQKEFSIDIFEQIDTDMSQIKSDGYGIFGVIDWLLDRDSTLKNDYIKRGLIDTVIQLSNKIGQLMSIILVVRKSRVRDDRSIRMINASDSYVSKNFMESIFNKQVADRAIKTWNKNNEYAGFVRNVSLKEIEKNNNALLPNRYVQSEAFQIQEDLSVRVDISKLEEADMYKLSDIAKVYTYGKNKSDFELKVNGKSTVKVKVDSKYVDKQWLKAFLDSPLGKTQLAKFNKKTVGNLRVPIVPLKQQIESIQKFNRVRIKVENVTANLDEAANEVDQRLYENMGISKVFEIINKNLPD